MKDIFFQIKWQLTLKLYGITSNCVWNFSAILNSSDVVDYKGYIHFCLSDIEMDSKRYNLFNNALNWIWRCLDRTRVMWSIMKYLLSFMWNILIIRIDMQLALVKKKISIDNMIVHNTVLDIPQRFHQCDVITGHLGNKWHSTHTFRGV